MKLFEKGRQADNPETQRFLVDNAKKNPESIIRAMISADRTIAAGLTGKEDEYIGLVLEKLIPLTRIYDEELRPYVKKIVDEKSAGKVVRKSGLEDNKDHGASIDYMIEQGGEAPPEVEKDHGNIDLSGIDFNKRDNRRNSLPLIHRKGTIRHEREMGVKDDD